MFKISECTAPQIMFYLLPNGLFFSTVMGRITSLSKTHVAVLNPTPQNVNIFGDQVF